MSTDLANLAPLGKLVFIMGLEEVKQQEMTAVAVDPRSTYAQRTAATVPSYEQQLPPGYVYDDEPGEPATLALHQQQLGLQV